MLLDEGVPDSVGEVCRKRGYTAILHREALLGGVKDEVVCEAALRVRRKPEMPSITTKIA